MLIQGATDSPATVFKWMNHIVEEAQCASKLLPSSFPHRYGLRGTLEQSWIADKKRKIMNYQFNQFPDINFRHCCQVKSSFASWCYILKYTFIYIYVCVCIYVHNIRI